jgi:proteasome accessory factor B
MHPLERLINLVALLLESRRPLTFDEIRDIMPAYQQEDHASAKRMFERDKDTLRDAGIPIDVTPPTRGMSNRATGSGRSASTFPTSS